MPRQGRHIFHTRLRLPHSEVIHPVCLEVRPAFELLGAEIKVSGAFPGEALLEVALRCNRQERVPPPVEILYAGRTYRSRIGKGEPVAPDLAEPGKRASKGARRRGSAPPHAAAPRPEVFRFRVKTPEWLAPGGMPVRVTVRALSGPVVLEGETRLWSLFAAWPEGASAFAARCTPLEIPHNDCLEALFTRAYEGDDAPFLNCWTWYEPEVINLDHVRECLRGGLFESDVGVPFQIPAKGEHPLRYAVELAPGGGNDPRGPAGPGFTLAGKHHPEQPDASGAGAGPYRVCRWAGRTDRPAALGRSTTCSSTTRLTTPSGWAENSEDTTGMAAHPARTPMS